MGKTAVACFVGYVVRHLLLVQLHALPFTVCVVLRRFVVSSLQASADQGGHLSIRHTPFVAFDVLRLSFAQQCDGHGLVATH